MHLANAYSRTQRPLLTFQIRANTQYFHVPFRFHRIKIYVWLSTPICDMFGELAASLRFSTVQCVLISTINDYEKTFSPPRLPYQINKLLNENAFIHWNTHTHTQITMLRLTIAQSIVKMEIWILNAIGCVLLDALQFQPILFVDFPQTDNFFFFSFRWLQMVLFFCDMRIKYMSPTRHETGTNEINPEKNIIGTNIVQMRRKTSSSSDL